MRFDEVQQLLEGIPYISPFAARRLYDFIVGGSVEECLEVGFAHGTSSCYIAAALQEKGAGHLTSVDLVDTPFDPTIEHLLDRTGLSSYVTVVREVGSYTWFLKRQIQTSTKDGWCEPLYDFAFVDGPKNWTIDGCGFFLIDKLLREQGWILFDDLDWTYAGSLPPGTEEADRVDLTLMAPDELREPHVRKIFELLVMQHPSYSEFKIENESWGWARKAAGERRQLQVVEHLHLADRARRLARLGARKVFGRQ